MTDGSDATFDVLFVCTGNVCRSPMGERLMSARAGSPVLRVASAGTHALAGWGMDAPSAQVLREHGGDPDGFVARQLTDDMVASAQLVLTASTKHRSIVLRQTPAAMRCVFTLREFARLASGAADFEPDDPNTAPAQVLAQRVAHVAAQRGRRGVARGNDNIGDPFGAPMSEVQRVGAQISDAVSATLRGLGLAA